MKVISMANSLNGSCLILVCTVCWAYLCEYLEKKNMGSAQWLSHAGFPQALEIMENHKKSSMHGKIMEFEKKNHPE